MAGPWIAGRIDAVRDRDRLTRLPGPREHGLFRLVGPVRPRLALGAACEAFEQRTGEGDRRGAVYDSNQSWGKPDRGIQLFGTAREVVGSAARDAERTYAKRFPGYRESEFSAYRFYRFRPRRLKLFDERALGTGVFVTASVTRGRLARTRTEIYHGSSGQ